MRAEYVWGESYKTALLEIDDSKLLERIQVSNRAIDARL
jgi:hypothetical protein